MPVVYGRVMTDRAYEPHRLWIEHRPRTREDAEKYDAEKAQATAESLATGRPGGWASRAVYACGPYKVVMELSPVYTSSATWFGQGVLQVSRLDVRPPAAGLSAVELRRIPVTKMTNDMRHEHDLWLIAVDLNREWEREEDPDLRRALLTIKGWARQEVNERVLGQTSSPDRRNRLPEGHFEKVASIYERATFEGKPPRRAIQQAFNPVAISTVSKWIAGCRQRGLLPPIEKKED